MAAAECTVWWAPLDHAGSASWPLLSDEERTRAQSFRRTDDQARSALGAALLRRAVNTLTGVAPSDVVVVRRCKTCGGPHGQPELPGTGLYGSISHAGHWVCVAVTAAGPVGVDIEPFGLMLRPWLLRAVAGPQEALDVRDGGNTLALWTRKEAVLKATGEGLTTPMQDVVVSPPDEPAALRSHAGRPALSCQLTDLDLVRGYAGTVAVVTTDEVLVREELAASID